MSVWSLQVGAGRARQGGMVMGHRHLRQQAPARLAQEGGRGEGGPMAAAAAQRRASGRPQGEGRQAGSPPVSAGGGLAGAQRVGGRRRGALQAVHVGVAEAQPVPRLVHGVIVAGKALGDDRALQWAGVSGVFRGSRLLLWGWPMGGDAPHRLLAASACAVPAPGSCRFYPCSPAAAPGTEGGQAVVRQRGQYQVHPGCLARIGQRLRGEEGSQAA